MTAYEDVIYTAFSYVATHVDQWLGVLAIAFSILVVASIRKFR